MRKIENMFVFVFKNWKQAVAAPVAVPAAQLATTVAGGNMSVIKKNAPTLAVNPILPGQTGIPPKKNAPSGPQHFLAVNVQVMPIDPVTGQPMPVPSPPSDTDSSPMAGPSGSPGAGTGSKNILPTFIPDSPQHGDDAATPTIKEQDSDSESPEAT